VKATYASGRLLVVVVAVVEVVVVVPVTTDLINLMTARSNGFSFHTT
jgi:hypothetical protein